MHFNFLTAILNAHSLSSSQHLYRGGTSVGCCLWRRDQWAQPPTAAPEQGMRWLCPCGGHPAVPGRWGCSRALLGTQLAHSFQSPMGCLPDGQMKAQLLSMQMGVWVALQLKNDKEIFTWLARNFFTLL